MVYALLVVFALFFLTPLVVVVLNSLRTAEEIGRGSVIGWPAMFAWQNYRAGLEQVLHRAALRGHPQLHVEFLRDGDPGDAHLDRSSARSPATRCRSGASAATT